MCHDKFRTPVDLQFQSVYLHPPSFGFSFPNRTTSVAPALVVPCTPIPVATSVCQITAYQVCSHSTIVDHVLHGMCSSVITFGQPTMSGGFLDKGGKTSKVI